MATEGARVDASAHGVPAPGRDAVRRNANAIAPGRTKVRCCKLPAAFYRLNLRPVRARRLSKAGRHWAPIARQMATRKERHSGRTGPTYCDKPNWVPPYRRLGAHCHPQRPRWSSRKRFLDQTLFLTASDVNWRRMRCRPYVPVRPSVVAGRRKMADRFRLWLAAIAGGGSNWCFRRSGRSTYSRADVRQPGAGRCVSPLPRE